MFKKLIEEIYHESKETYGAGKIQAILKHNGYNISEKTVSSIMQGNGWFAVRNGSKNIFLQLNKEKANNT